MKIKKKYLNTVIHQGKRKIIISDVVDEATMKVLINEFPYCLEKEKPKKKKVEDVASEE